MSVLRARSTLLDMAAGDLHRVGRPLRFQLEGDWARRGPYRVIDAIRDDEVLVGISHRAAVYV
jgi:mRNA interferase RelE/StbE